MDYAEFSQRYGKEIIEKSSAPISLATPDQLTELQRLVDLLKIDSETIEKWLEKANAETLAELNTDQANKITEFLKSKIK